MRQGVNLGDPDTFQQVVQHLIATLGEAWLTKRLAETKSPSDTATDEGSRLLSALAEYPAMLVALRAKQAPRDPTVMLHLAMVAWAISECCALPGGTRWGKKLRSLAQSEQWGGFFDTFFEGEAALYWRDQMHARAVEFPAASHPDFLATVSLAGHELSIPNECKRIAPTEKRESDLGSFAANLDKDVYAWVATHEAIKVIVWLHDQAIRISEPDVMLVVADVAAKALEASTAGRWLTASNADGRFQVSVAAAGELGELKERAIEVQDVPAVGPLYVRVETVYLGKAQDPAKLKYVLSIRSDVLPNRIGALERNLNKAIRQVAVSTNKAPGSINVRIRPPRAQGDVYEADWIVRRVLRSLDAKHIALVVLFWNEGEREEGEWQQVEGQPQRTVTVGYGLVPYFIAHDTTPLDFSTIDSRIERFGAEHLTAIRDPETGSMVPVDPRLLEQVAHGPVTERSDTQKQSSESGYFMYLELVRPFPEGITRQAIQPIEAEGRVFVPIFDDQEHVRFVEFVMGQPARVATLDLRAWRGQRELLFTLRWVGEQWTVGSPTPDEIARVIASSSPLRVLT